MHYIPMEQDGKLVYQDYQVHSAKAALQRSGFLIAGCCDDENHHYAGLPGAETSLVSDPHRPDSGAEHVEGCIQLAFAVSMWRSDLISASELRRVTQLFLYHDAPEVVNGDVPDDGNRNDGMKDDQEYAILCEQVAHWPILHRSELLQDFRDFQQHNGRLFQVAYCLDKIEAVLRVLEYERHGIAADLRDKKDQMSEQDRKFAEEIGTYSMADGWARHALERIQGCAGRELAYWIMAAAFCSVRGEMPQWMIDWKIKQTKQL